MSPAANEILWVVSRATGVAATVLLTVVFILGVMLSGRRRPTGTQTTVITGLHRNLALGLTVFLTAHVITAVVETYVDIGWVSALVPFTSAYEPVWVSLGAIAFDLLIAVTMTSLLRHRVPDMWWQRIHALAYVLWPAAIVHGIALGTGSGWVLRAISITCLAAGIGAVIYRLVAHQPDKTRRHQIREQPWR
ncbi:ferric reductase-like transmembrane domain-containing protein [Arthrobacter sp. B1805]|uniref:ferric reductase-like transmembrane domain-containing protein n=1 Tax=Arthrobacter sp. B1805 TaxID=2058892 RepID=UPI000CE45E57|nr:ferric reductase-like transmembrane domain-containing protein [Arthrobacter sp. B1805]